MRRPSIDDLLLAAKWLEVNEGDEASACRRVAAWLCAQAEDRENRELAKEMKVPLRVVKALRRKDESSKGSNATRAT